MFGQYFLDTYIIESDRYDMYFQQNLLGTLTVVLIINHVNDTADISTSEERCLR